MTHAELVERGERWLRNSAVIHDPHHYPPEKLRGIRCGVVLCEPVCGSEIPDCIGWIFGGQYSMLIECKASRADFMRDKNKWTRREKSAQHGLGNYRYYMAVPGIITPEEIPPRWGLLECRGRVVRVLKAAEFQEGCRRREMAILVSECAKIQIVQKGGRLVPTRAGQRITAALLPATPPEV